MDNNHNSAATDAELDQLAHFIDDELDIRLNLDDDDSLAGGSEEETVAGGQTEEKPVVDTRNWQAELQAEQTRVADAEARIAIAEEERLKESRNKMEAQLAFADERSELTEMKIKDLKRKLKAAKEEGDDDEESDIETQISKLESDRTKLSGIKDNLKAELAKKPEPKKETVKAQPAATTSNTPPQEAQNWVGRNPWFGKPATQKSDEEHVRYNLALQINGDLQGEGRSNSDPAFYAELDKRLTAQMQARTKANPNKPRSPVANVNNGNGDKKAMNNKTIELTKRDIQIMQTLKLDPTDPVHRTEYAYNKRDTMRDGDGKPTMKRPVRNIPNLKK